MRQIEQYRVFEMEVPAQTNAVFSLDDIQEEISSFQAGEKHLIRFMPMKTGTWRYKLTQKNGVSDGSFLCLPAKDGNHGPVHACGMGFAYADGTPYQPFGTTCYAWTHQPEDVRKQTLETLSNAPFNKLRMCVFPKHMIYSENEPAYFPFVRRTDGSWDVSRPVEDFWRDFETQLFRLDRLGIESDVILFHPYDRWGFAELSREDSLHYLDYCVRRLGAYKNVWWSLANEYDLLLGKTEEDWEAFADRLLRDDAKRHLRSIHNCCQPYPKRDWMTHVSLQTSAPRKALAMRSQYQLPVIVDEFGYEGDIEFSWGNLTAREFVNRAWTAVCSGAWPTHGETLLNAQEHLWWAKGGKLQGETKERIRFLRDMMAALPGTPEPLIQPLNYDVNGTKVDEKQNPFVSAMMRLNETDRIAYMLEITPTALKGENWQLYYFGRGQSQRVLLQLPENVSWTAEIIDTWEMKREEKQRGLKGNVRIDLGGTESMALLMIKEEELQ
ncbi:MAG: DUF5605 domain-containing protein [Clostridia bacterium]|nr:DUF5605 domain-containing protein [Clostridia bacterium]